ncbi:MAG: MFS transporter [Wenzhouxiangella sp.]
MIAEFGQISLILALVLATLLATVPLYGAYRNNEALMNLAPSLVTGHFVFALAAFVSLATLFLTHDFTVVNVATNSNLLLPWFYRLAATWGSHEGSLLLWILMLAGWMLAVALLSRSSLPKPFLTRVLSVMGAISIGFLLFTLLTSNPFDRILPGPPDGQDLNPLLQDPGMIFHPPLLYMGYVGFSVAFGFAIAGLLGGRVERDWVRWSRPWTLLAWAFYDWANSAFATVVIAGFFPVFFSQFWASELSDAQSTQWLGYASSAGSLILVLSAPVLGALADQLGAKKRFLLGFTLLGLLATGSLFWVEAGQWQLALLLYLAGLLGFFGSNIFNDALITDVAAPRDYERASSLAYALGYLGDGLLFAFFVLLVLMPERFGLADEGAAVRLSFLGVAIWWALFTLPLLLLVPESTGLGRRRFRAAVRGAFGELALTFRQIRQLPNSFLFLLAYWFYIDGVDTVMFMAVKYGLGLSDWILASRARA